MADEEKKETSTPPPSMTETKSESPRTPDGTASVTAEAPAETAEKPKKSLLAKLSQSAIQTKPENAAGKADTNRDGYVSAREAINSLNTGMVIDTPSEDEVIAQEVAKQLEKQAEYFVIRVRKSKMILTLGLTVLLLWLVPLTLFLQQKYNFSLLTYISTGQATPPTPVPQVTPTPTATPFPAVRIKAGAEKASSAAELKTQLTAAGFTRTEVENVTIKEKGVFVAVKSDQTELQNQLLTFLTPSYPTATAAAALLSDDSDFSAVIILGKVTAF